MKAIVYARYGGPDVFGLKEVEKPAPEADEALVKVRAAAPPYPLPRIHFLRAARRESLRSFQ